MFISFEHTFKSTECAFKTYERRFIIGIESFSIKKQYHPCYQTLKRADLTASPFKILSKIQIGMT